MAFDSYFDGDSGSSLHETYSMSPYIFRYHRSPTSESEFVHENRRRHNNYSESYTKRKLANDNNSLYGEFVYEEDDESELAERTKSPRIRKYYDDKYRHSNQRIDQKRSNHHFDQPDLHVRYEFSRSEPPLKSRGQQEQYFEMPNVRTYRRLDYVPRIALLDKRYGRETDTHCDCHACPQKSSKNIPTMHYDELRCPHCASYAQPTEEEVMAYPWSVQSYRPKRRTFKEELFQPERIPTTRVAAPPESSVSMSQSTRLSSQMSSLDRSSVRLIDKEKESSVVSLPKRIFKNNSDTHSEVRTYSQLSKRSAFDKRKSDMQIIQENDYDDVKPSDSISNVSLPPLRVKSTEFIRNFKSSPKIRTETTVYGANVRDKIFMDSAEPHTVLPTPRPTKDTASGISRMLKGEYYERGNGRTYAYNVNYSPKKLTASEYQET